MLEVVRKMPLGTEDRRDLFELVERTKLDRNLSSQEALDHIMETYDHIEYTPQKGRKWLK